MALRASLADSQTCLPRFLAIELYSHNCLVRTSFFVSCKEGLMRGNFFVTNLCKAVRENALLKIIYEHP